MHFLNLKIFFLDDVKNLIKKFAEIDKNTWFYGWSIA